MSILTSSNAIFLVLTENKFLLTYLLVPLHICTAYIRNG